MVGRVTWVAQCHRRPPTVGDPLPVISGRSPLSGLARGTLAGQSGICVPPGPGCQTPTRSILGTSTLAVEPSGPAVGASTGVTGEDLSVLWSSLSTMWDHTRSAARANITTRGLYVFTHSSTLGDAPAGRLLETITVRKSTDAPPRAFVDYAIGIPDPGSIPDGVRLSVL